MVTGGGAWQWGGVHYVFLSFLFQGVVGWLGWVCWWVGGWVRVEAGTEVGWVGLGC